MKSEFSRGNFRKAAEIFDTVGDVGIVAGALMRARIYLKTSPSDAIAYLLSIAPRNARSKAERDMLLAAAHSRAGDLEAADHYFALSGTAVNDVTLRDEIRYHQVRRYLVENRLEEARSELIAIQASGREPLRALHLESFVLSQEGRYSEQARVLIELLRQIDVRDAGSTEINAWATHTLAALCRDMFVPEGLPLVEYHTNDGLWPDDFAANHFQALKAIGWARALQGDYFNAFRYLKRATEAAPGAPWTVMGFADCALLARCIGEPRWSRQELDEAERAAERVDWHATRGEERIALLLLAELFAPIDPARASYFLSQYTELPALHTPLAHYMYDERLAAIAHYCTGVVHASLGNEGVALKALRKSLKAFERFGYDWRAGRSLLAIYTLTHDARALEGAAERLRHYGTSWLGEELKRIKATSTRLSLPPMQRLIFEAMCRGLKPAEIAQDLGRAENTVRNHIKLIFKAFKVNSRPALLAEAARQGFLGAQPSSPSARRRTIRI